MTQLCGGQFYEAALLGQAGHRHVQHFTFLQGSQAHGRLGLIRVALDHSGLLPYR
jgi:hypothetical protein